MESHQVRGGAGIHLRRLVLPVYLPMVLISIGIGAPAAAFPLYLGSLGSSIAGVGFIVSLSGVGNMLIDLPSGLILGRNPIRPVMIAGLAASAATALGIALTRNVTLIGFLTLLGGASRSIIITGMMTYVRLTVPPNLRGRALSAVGGSSRVGLLIGPFVGGLISDKWGVPYAFGLQAVSLVLAALMLAGSPDRSMGVGIGTAPAKERPADLVRGMSGRWSALMTTGAGILVLQLLRGARTVILPLWGDSIGLSVTVIGAVMSAGAFMDLLLFMPAGQIMDRAGRKVAGSLCVGLFATGVALLPITGGLAGFVVASVVIGLGNGFGSGINMTLGTDLAPTAAVSMFLGAWRLFGDIGAAAGPAIVGALTAVGGLTHSLSVTAAIGGGGLLIMMFLVPETLRIAEREE